MQQGGFKLAPLGCQLPLQVRRFLLQCPDMLHFGVCLLAELGRPSLVLLLLLSQGGLQAGYLSFSVMHPVPVVTEQNQNEIVLINNQYEITK